MDADHDPSTEQDANDHDQTGGSGDEMTCLH
jgi:hypothetical protein